MKVLSVLHFGALSALMGLTACSNTNNNAQNTAEPATVASQADQTAPTKPAKTVAITAIVEHPSLDAIRQGVIDEIEAQGYEQGKNLTVNFQSAQGSTAIVGQISKQFVADNPDVIVALSTPSAQSMAAASKDIPIVYTAVSNPIAAKLIDSNNQPTQANITGLSSQLPLAPQLDFMQQIMPNVNAIGYVYSAGEMNSVSLKNDLNAELPKRGLKLVEIPTNRPNEIAMATKALDGKAQMIYTSLDNNVASAMESMVESANTLKLPIIASDEFSVRRGAAAALGVNDYDFGRATGKMVVKILDGTPVNQVAPAVMNELTLYVSPKHAQLQGLTFPDSVLQKALNVDTTPALTYGKAK
ncbi:ABC transporter substrate-binding protein [Moraxella macacae 0408225]|uniref:ABC transporter substrate-binding protein n=1 Tax=Moraxella macacae 0408225 TaxID=1230338 RepID=L2F7L5_9GAMM|nr:ABC transporter substrate-binding protein [Moraxella macacae]ELA08900.1 ABC transporter substrate-binding protein [Moraxella macacae 0408225]